MIVAVGLDVVDLARIRRVMERHGARFVARCFTEAEAEAMAQRSDPVPGLAARFAAKEAFAKCWPDRLGWREVGVRSDARGAPSLAFSERLAAELMARGLSAHLSLTHSPEVAAAVVVLEQRG